MGKYYGWRLFLWVVAAYHVAIGSLLMFSGELSIRAARALAGMTITGSPELGIAGEILACYILAFGLMAGVAAWDPVKNRAFVSVAMVLFALRLFQRIYFADKVMKVFQVPSSRYWTAVGIVAVFTVSMGLFRLRLYRDMHMR